MGKRKSMRVRVGYGRNCARCGRLMLRYKHNDEWTPPSSKGYYFAYWDICHDCQYLKHYETAKVSTKLRRHPQ